MKLDLAQAVNIGSEEVPVVISSVSFRNIGITQDSIYVETIPGGLDGAIPLSSFSDDENTALNSLLAIILKKIVDKIQSNITSYPSIPVIIRDGGGAGLNINH